MIIMPPFYSFVLTQKKENTTNIGVSGNLSIAGFLYLPPTPRVARAENSGNPNQSFNHADEPHDGPWKERCVVVFAVCPPHMTPL